MKTRKFCISLALVTLLGLVSATAVRADGSVVLPLSIVGTMADVDFATGQASLYGDLFIRGTTANVGDYFEATQLIPDANGLPAGGIGDSTFTFQIFGFTVGTITTHNISTVLNISPQGVLTVKSTGAVTNATGIFDDVTGGLVSCSSVILAPSFFALDADVTLTLSE